MAKKKKSKKKTTKKRGMSVYDAMNFHKTERSTRSQIIDENKTAKITKDYVTKSWYKNPAGSDILGVDSKKFKAKNVSEAISFLQSTLKINIKKDDIQKTSPKRAIITYPYSANTLQKNLSVRFNNVKVYKRKKKGRHNDKVISVLKGRV